MTKQLGVGPIPTAGEKLARQKRKKERLLSSTQFHTKVKSLATVTANLQNTLREFRAEIRMRPSVLRENQQGRPSERWCFQEKSL